MDNIFVPYAIQEKLQDPLHVVHRSSTSQRMRFAWFESSLVVDLEVVSRNTDMYDICSGTSASSQKWRTDMICACALAGLRQDR